MATTPDPNPGHGPAQLPATLSSPGLPGSPVQGPSALVAYPAPVAKIEPIGLLKALGRRWKLAAFAGLTCSAIAGVVVYFLVPPAQYTARSLLHVNSIQPRILLQVRESSVDFPAYQRTQLAMLRSRLVLNAALNADGGRVAKLKSLARQADPIEWLEKELKVEFANGSEILQIGASGNEAEEPMILVNAVTHAYLEEVVNVEEKQRRERFDLLKETWSRYQNSLKDKRKELRQLAEFAGSDDRKTLANLQQLELTRLGRVEDDLARVRSELRGLRIEEEVLRGEESRAAPPIVTPAMIEKEIAADRAIEALAKEVARARQNLAETVRIARLDGDPAAQQARKALDAARKALDAQRTKLYPIIAQDLQARSELGEGGGAKLATLRERIQILAKTEALLADDAKHLAERSQTISKTSVDLGSIQEEIAAAENVSKTIGAEVEALKLELQAPPRIKLLEKAVLPRTKDEQRPIKMARMAAGGVFAIVLLGVSFWEFRARRIDSVDEVVQGLGMKVVGTLPTRPDGGRLLRSRAARRQRWQSQMIESVDAARTALLHSSRIERIRTVMVASAVSGEGKTSLACHLSTSLARAGRRTLLIDGDIRRPSAHRLFDLPQGPGLGEVLRGQASIDEVARPAQAEGLWVVTGGEVDGEAIQALAYPDRLGTVLERCKQQFDFVVIDSSPILPVPDALLIGQHADAVLFSIMRDVSRIPTVHAAYARLSSLGIRMLGAVVTGVSGDHYPSGYSYGGYGYGDRPRKPA